jgi:hypothetical protein
MKSNEFSVVVEGEVRQSAQGRKPCRCDNCRHILVSGPNRILRIHSNDFHFHRKLPERTRVTLNFIFNHFSFLNGRCYHIEYLFRVFYNIQLLSL